MNRALGVQNWIRTVGTVAEGTSCKTQICMLHDVSVQPSAVASAHSLMSLQLENRWRENTHHYVRWSDDSRQVIRLYKPRLQQQLVLSPRCGHPDAADNRWLREAYENRIPIIYFLGIAPGRYQAMLPAFISGWDAKALKARVAFGVPDQDALAPPENALERRYALRAVKQRLHQASFREAVITAYNRRCALSGLPEALLLDAAHIISDKDEKLGQPVVPNGIPLSKIHHAAFDAHLIGIDADYKLHVAEPLLVQNDGPMLEALKRLNGGMIYLPNRAKDRPDLDRLAQRYERFKAAA